MSKSISDEKIPKVWLLKSFGEERQHAGNLGYEDEISKMYQYDEYVPNYKNLTEGDLVLLRDKEQLLGVAKIERIKRYEGQKLLLRCPSCNKTGTFKKRKTKTPPFNCYKCRYSFYEPISKEEPCKKFNAYFGDTFIAAKGAINLELLQKSVLDNIQFAIQLINFDKIQAALLKNAPAVAKLLNEKNASKYLQDDEASEYVPVREDSHETVFRQIKERRGQSKFRNLLRQRYGDQCMITGLKLLDVLEAAHISPYRSTDDNHPDNGLLLRADLHTLFDLNLLGIHPEYLEVKFHPKVLKTGYQKLDGRKLICCEYKPSKSALVSKWQQFLNRLKEEDSNL
ncbi:hypothetical protein BV378_32400 [Nostoc sp. RF31YmG]|nr:hypothetical protein BV378_32400 [Nostoc sp. RF31YmG]